MKLALDEAPPMHSCCCGWSAPSPCSPRLLLPARAAAAGARRAARPVWVGQLQVAAFLICSIIGLAIVPAGRAIVLAYTMPLWAVPIGLWLWPEPLGRFQLAGAAVGFAGLVLFMNPGLVDWGDWHALAGNALLLLAAISLGARLLPLSPPRLALVVLGADLLAARGQHRRGRGYCLAECAGSRYVGRPA